MDRVADKIMAIKGDEIEVSHALVEGEVNVSNAEEHFR